jgi:hypothetical protein
VPRRSRRAAVRAAPAVRIRRIHSQVTLFWLLSEVPFRERLIDTVSASSVPPSHQPMGKSSSARSVIGARRAAALREYALGLEALERAARGEPLWRVPECLLALESESVDPRL